MCYFNVPYTLFFSVPVFQDEDNQADDTVKTQQASPVEDSDVVNEEAEDLSQPGKI